MTTNQFPYKFDNDINQLMARVMNCDLQIPTLPREFKPIIEGCLQKDRRQRWTAQQVLNALQPQVTGKMPVSQIPLKTAKADFTQLDRYLKNGQWREADLETGMVILKIVNKTHGSLTKENCENFPREELQIIDSLWLKYSSGKFGFSVQKKIWIECGGEVGVRDFHIWRKFADKIGWRNSMGDWLFPPTEFTYNINAPRGNLPCWEIFDLEESEDMKYQQYTYTLRNVLASMEDDGLLGGSLFLSRL